MKNRILAAAALVFAVCPVVLQAGLNSWTGNGPSGGRTTRVLIDPVNTDRMYLLGHGVGLHTSNDAGATWQKTNPDLPEIRPSAIADIAIDPNAPSTLFVVDSGPEVARSLDGGQTWAVFTSGLDGAGLYYLYASPAAAGLVYATDGGGLYRSTDNGANWTLASGNLPVTVISEIVFDPTDASTIYATSWEGFFKSTDGGDTWNQLSNGLPAPNAQGYVFAKIAIVDPTDTQTIYLQVSNEGVYKSTDGGASWNPASIGVPNDFFTRFVIDPVDSDRIYLGTGNNDVVVTTNGGAFWQDLPNAGLGDTTVDDLVVDPTDPDRLYAATFMRGVFVSTDAGASWTDTSTGFVNTTVQSVGYDPAAQRVYAGVDGGTAVSHDDGATWTLNTGDYDLATYAITPDPLLPDHAYLGSSCCGLYESFDAGGTWSRVDLAIDGIVASWVTDIDIPDSDQQILYFTDYNRGLFKTDDAGVTWASLTTGLQPFFSGNVQLNAIDAAGDQPQVVFAASDHYNDGGVFKSVDGGFNWTRQSGSGQPGPTRAEAVAAHPTDPAIVMAGGFGGLYRSTDGGDSWGASPVLFGSITDIYIDYADPELAYAIADNATLYRSIDGGVTWEATIELPEATPTELAVDANNPGRVFVGFRNIGVQEYGFATDLVLAQTVSTTEPSPGERVSVDVTLSNAGPLGASAISLSQTLPANLAWISATPSQGNCGIDLQTLTCDLGTLADGDSATVALQFDATSAGPVDSPLAATAREVEIDAANNLVALVLNVGGAADTDGDGIADDADNCSDIANADQLDTDADGFGNRCDADLNNDCSVNFGDLAQLKSVFLTSDPDADFDGSGTVNFGDLAQMKALFLDPPGPSGVPNICDGN